MLNKDMLNKLSPKGIILVYLIYVVILLTIMLTVIPKYKLGIASTPEDILLTKLSNDLSKLQMLPEVRAKERDKLIIVGRKFITATRGAASKDTLLSRLLDIKENITDTYYANLQNKGNSSSDKIDYDREVKFKRNDVDFLAEDGERKLFFQYMLSNGIPTDDIMESTMVYYDKDDKIKDIIVLQSTKLYSEGGN